MDTVFSVVGCISITPTFLQYVSLQFQLNFNKLKSSDKLFNYKNWGRRGKDIQAHTAPHPTKRECDSKYNELLERIKTNAAVQKIYSQQR